jgi:predicted dehydrogenase
MNKPDAIEPANTIKPVRIALVGLGGHGHTIQRAAEATPALRVEAVYDPDAGEARAAAERFGAAPAASYEALLRHDGLEAVALITPNVLHREQTAAALAAGLDVLVEKPIANTVADGQAMVDAAAGAGRILMVGHNMRRSRAVRRARALLDEGRLGTLVSVEVHFSADNALWLDASSWRLRADQCPLLPMMQLGIHGVDLLHYLIGRVERVQALARSVTTRPPVIDNVVATMVLEGGVLGTFVSNYASPVYFGYRISGTGGTMIGTPHTLTVDARGGGRIEDIDASEAPYASFTEQMEDFARAVRSHTPSETDGAVGLQALAVVEAMNTSVARRAAVDVPDLHPHR